MEAETIVEVAPVSDQQILDTFADYQLFVKFRDEITPYLDAAAGTSYEASKRHAKACDTFALVRVYSAAASNWIANNTDSSVKVQCLLGEPLIPFDKIKQLFQMLKKADDSLGRVRTLLNLLQGFYVKKGFPEQAKEMDRGMHFLHALRLSLKQHKSAYKAFYDLIIDEVVGAMSFITPHKVKESIVAYKENKQCILPSGYTGQEVDQIRRSLK